jgi:molybdopterin-guanine dinucleotide biosynthesis protein A
MSRRFGGINKSLIEVAGVPIIDRIISVLKPLFHEIIIAGWPAGSPLQSGVRLTTDNFAGLGPLAGIESAMSASATPLLFVFGGDMPWLSEKLIRQQAEEMLSRHADILVPMVNGLVEPLHSIYRCTIHEKLQRYLLSDGRPAVIDFYTLVDTRYLELPSDAETAKAFTNINRPEDLHGA